MLVAALAGTASAQQFTEIPGSPFVFTLPQAVNSNVVQLSADEQRLFVANQESASVSVLDVAPSGAVSLREVSPTGPRPCGLALSPAGDRLYVATGQGVFVHHVSADGTLPVLQTVPAQGGTNNPMNGIQYASLGGGDFVYVNESVSPSNFVTAWRVLPDGLLEWAGQYATGAAGVQLGLYAATRLLALHADLLFAGNEGSVSAFRIGADGTLALVEGSPFRSPLPPAPPPPGYLPPFAVSLALDPAGTALYALLDGVDVTRFAIGPGGALTYDVTFTAGTTAYPATSLAMHPSGRWLVGAYPQSGNRVWDTAAPGPAVTTFASGAGLEWNAAGTRLFVGGGSLTTMRVRVFDFSEVARFALTVFPSGAGAGVVTSDVAGITCPSDCSGDFVSGSTVTLTAAAGPSSVFTGWSGCTSVNASGQCVVAMTASVNVFATFKPASTVTVRYTGTGQGTAAGVPWDACSTSGCSGRVATGGLATLTAAPSPGSVFKAWAGCSSVTAAQACLVYVPYDRAVEARFEPATYLLTIVHKGLGHGTVSGTAAGLPIAWGGCGPNPQDVTGTICTALIANGAQVVLTAAAEQGSTFRGWGVVCAGTGSCSFKMNGTKSPWATFSSP